MRASATSALKRSGFTLIELMLVIAIIAILMALSIPAVMQVVEAQRRRNTENTMRIVATALDKHWDAVVKEASTEAISPAVLALAGNNENRARVLWKKLRLAEAFPQSYAEITTAMGGGGIYATGRGPWIPPNQRRYMKTYADAIKNAPAGNAATQSSACLLLALKANRGGAKLDEGDLMSFIADTDNDGVKELIDGWGRPFHFQRFATDPPNADLVQMNPRAPTDPKAKFGDLLDAEGLLQQDNWLATNGTAFAALCNHPFPASNPQPFFRPYLSSDGRDGATGTADDMFSYNLGKQKGN